MAKQNALTGTSFSVWQQLNKIVWSWLYLFPILHKYYKAFTYMFIDFNNMSNKSLTNKFLPMEWTITEDGRSITWYDYNMFDVELTITGDNNAATSITTAEVTWLQTAWFEVWDQIMIVRAAGSTKPTNERREITAIVADTSITWSGAVDLDVWDKVIRVYYVQAEEQEIQRGSSKYKYIEFKSYFQNFGRTVSFTKTDLNKQYLIEKDAKTYVASIFGFNMSILLQEFGKAIWLGQNDDSSVNPWAKPEMLGIDTAIMQQAVTDTSLITNFSSYPTADEKIWAFMDAIELSWASGAIQAWETLSVACNRKFLSALGRLKKDDIVYNEKIVEIDFTIYKFKNMFAQVEFFHEPTLDKLSQDSLAYIVPRSLMSLRFRKFQNLNDEKWTMEPAKTEITVRRKINNIYDKAQFDMFFEAATVLGWLTSGAYRKLIKL